MTHTPLVIELTILVLAIFLGFEVISKVPTMLHTPLMSGTNFIHGIVIVGLTNVPSLMPADSSRLYARNVSALLEHLAPGGELALDFDDEITAGACVTRPTAEVTA